MKRFWEQNNSLVCLFLCVPMCLSLYMCSRECEQASISCSTSGGQRTTQGSHFSHPLCFQENLLLFQLTCVLQGRLSKNFWGIHCLYLPSWDYGQILCIQLIHVVSIIKFRLSDMDGKHIYPLTNLSRLKIKYSSCR